MGREDYANAKRNVENAEVRLKEVQARRQDDLDRGNLGFLDILSRQINEQEILLAQLKQALRDIKDQDHGEAIEVQKWLEWLPYEIKRVESEMEAIKRILADFPPEAIARYKKKPNPIAVIFERPSKTTTRNEIHKYSQLWEKSNDLREKFVTLAAESGYLLPPEFQPGEGPKNSLS